MNNSYTCIVTGQPKYISPKIAKVKIAKFGSETDFRKHYVCPAAAKLLRAGTSVNDIRQELGGNDLDDIDPYILTRLNLLRKKPGARLREAEEVAARSRYLNSDEFKNKMRRIAAEREHMTYSEWVETSTGIGKERGGTCIRPDIFLSHNNRACDGCQAYEYCMCDGKRLSHEKKIKRKKR